MRTLVMCCCAAAFVLAAGAPALAAEYDPKRVEKIVADLKAGKPVMESGSLAKADAQLVTVTVSDGLTYIVDYRAKACFATGGPGQALAFVPCQALRQGYPVLSPILTWDDGRRRPMPGQMMRRPGAPGTAPGPSGPPKPQQ